MLTASHGHGRPYAEVSEEFRHVVSRREKKWEKIQSWAAPGTILSTHGKPMQGWVMIDLDGVQNVPQVKTWIQRAVKFVSKLPVPPGVKSQ
jgi:hypothetical protein